MEKEVFSQELIKKLKILNINLEDNQAEMFYKYMNLLIEWNEKMNLTAIIEPSEIILKHFADSLTIKKYINENEQILDIGTGAGFPGIPLKISENSFKITLLDSLNKRINFLKEVISKLNLQNIRAVHGRAEEFIKQNGEREKYDVVTSRAVARLNILVEYMLPFVKIGGKCICMKASNIEEELNEAEKAIDVLGGKIEKIDTIILPESDIERKIIIIKKIKETSDKYPRKAGMPAKEPIK